MAIDTSVILSEAKNLQIAILRSFAVSAAQDDAAIRHSPLAKSRRPCIYNPRGGVHGVVACATSG